MRLEGSKMEAAGRCYGKGKADRFLGAVAYSVAQTKGGGKMRLSPILTFFL